MLGDRNSVENGLALREDLINVLQTPPIGLGKEEVDAWSSSRSGSGCEVPIVVFGKADLHGNVRNQLMHAYTMGYRYPMVEKPTGVISATTWRAKDSD